MSQTLKTYLSKNKKLIALVSLLHLTFFIIKISLGNFFLTDSYEYYHLAENIKASYIFYSADINQPIIIEEFTKRPPIYALFILTFSFLLKSKSLILIVQNVLSVISILLTLEVFKHYWKSINQWLYIVLVSITMTQFIYANYIMSEILFQFFIVLLCYVFHLITTKKKLNYVLLFQVIITLLFLTKPVFYIFVIPNVALGIWFSKYIKLAYLYSIIPIVALLLYMSWNQSRTGNFEVSSIQNINLVNYNLKYFHINKYGEEYAYKINNEIHAEASALNTYEEKQKRIKELSVEHIKKDFFSYLAFHFKGSLRMLIDPGRFDMYNFFEFEKTNDVGFLKQLNSGGISGAINYLKSQPLLIVVLIPIILVVKLIILLAFIRFWLKNLNSSPSVFWFSLLLIIYIVGLTGPLGASRFLLPVSTLYCAFATLGLSRIKLFKKIIS